MFKGIAASKGIGIGTTLIVKDVEPVIERETATDIEAEKKRLNDSVEKFKQVTTEMEAKTRKNVGPKEAEILLGHIMIASDPAITQETEKLIEAGTSAEKAFDTVCANFITLFANMPDEMMRQRATDIKDVKRRILKIMLGIEEADLSDLPKDTILVTEELTPSMTSQINADNVVAFITEVGGTTSHSAILARALEIPAVLSVPDCMNLIKGGVTAIVDGTEGSVKIDPDEKTIEEFKARRDEYIKQKEALNAFRGKETKGSDGAKYEVFCNIGTPEETKNVVKGDGEGVGLFRTEFLFMNNTKMPSEDEQFAAYKKVAESLEGKEIIIRTLDIGGDKAIPYLDMKPEENPFMGYRAIRYCLGHVEAFDVQLRALLRASAFGNIKIMIPLVTCIEEYRKAKEILEETKKKLDAEGIAYNKDIKLGVMIETAAASLIADIFAEEADFFSIGTNDLTGYTMSADRGNADIAYLYSTFQPSVLRSIRNIITEGKKAGIPVGMCGEAAADPLMVPLLMSFGLDEFSVDPVHVLQTRSIISKWSKAEADEVCKKALGFKTEAEIREYMQSVSK